MFAIEPIYKSTMNGNYVINIGRQLGSGGKEIGEKLAVRLGIDFYDKELINLASEGKRTLSGVFRESRRESLSGYYRRVVWDAFSFY